MEKKKYYIRVDKSDANDIDCGTDYGIALVVYNAVTEMYRMFLQGNERVTITLDHGRVWENDHEQLEKTTINDYRY